MNLDAITAAAIPLGAQSVWSELTNVSFLEWLTNSVFLSLVTTVTVILFAQRATRHMKLVPNGAQNLFEAVIAALYDLFEGIVGRHMIGKVFPLLASLFIFILISNWFALIPGVGSIGWGDKTGFLTVPDIHVPLLRPGTADLNLTLALAAVFMLLWLKWTIQELGVGGFVKHTFGVKGGIKGFMLIPLTLIFAFVGMIEIVSMAFRPVSLSLRLFGNVFAGENLLVTMIGLGKTMGLPDFFAYASSIVIPIPFYFLEILIGLLQAIVFTLLCAVYIQLSTTHDEGSAHH
jgi:F-type H+-transporting ATPase subunit a